MPSLPHVRVVSLRMTRKKSVEKRCKTVLMRLTSTLVKVTLLQNLQERFLVTLTALGILNVKRIKFERKVERKEVVKSGVS